MTKRKRKNEESPIENYLNGDEKILWMGAPDPKRIFNIMDIILIPFSIIWCVGVYYGIWGTIVSMGFKGLLLSVMTPFFWMAVWLIPGRFVYQYYRRRKTTYAVTTGQILILDTFFKIRCKSYKLNALPELEIRSVKKDSTGTVKISGIAPPMFSHSPKSTFRTDLFDIPDVWDVYNLIKNVRPELQTNQN